MDLQTMQSILGIVLSVVAIIGLPLGIYKFYIKDQQTDGEKLTNSEKLTASLSSKIDLLESKISGTMKTMEATIGGEMKALTIEFTNIKLNHLHTIEEKQKDQDAQIGKLTIATEKLITIIDERVPRKTVDT